MFLLLILLLITHFKYSRLSKGSRTHLDAGKTDLLSVQKVASKYWV